MKRKKYLYHISFFFEYGGATSVLLARDHKINSVTDYREVEEYLKERNNLDKIVIFNINLLGKVRDYVS